MSAIARLHSLGYSSKAIRNELEKLALNDDNEDVRKDAFAALNLPTHRNVRKFRRNLTETVAASSWRKSQKWEKLGFLENENAEVIRRRYDFDFTPAPAEGLSAISSTASSTRSEGSILSETKNDGPRLTLLQTLLSEASIKIYLYLGAFFVIASASIIGATVPELRLPILIMGTLIFGGLSLAIKKRLPQPSFALFIVFSFLLPITANTIQEMLRQSLNLNKSFSTGYWVIVYFIMAVIWSGSTWLYESRLFSITAFISLTLSLFGIGRFFNAEAEFYTTLAGFAAIAGLAGVWLLKKWRSSHFAFFPYS